ncbi:MAG: selenium-binding family protein [Pirellulales bacterium]|nr:selenium-binding family protein [Pirellulales bacterium]
MWHRRAFLSSAAAAAVAAGSSRLVAGLEAGRTHASPKDAMAGPPEDVAYVTATYAGTDVERPDYLAVVDVSPRSPTYSQVIHRLEMPHRGDELHHFGWNACSSCHGQRARRYLIVPGLVSSRLHVVDVSDRRRPRLHRVIAPEEVTAKAGLTAPHTVHCLPDGQIMISMLGNDRLEGPGGFLLLDEAFDVLGSWEATRQGMHYNYDFWYQPRHNVMVSSEWAAPSTTRPGFNPDDVRQGKYGRRLHFWDWQQRRIVHSADLGEEGLIPLEVRFQHNPDSSHGFVGAALSSSIWHWYRDAQEDWRTEKVVQVEPVEVEGWPFPVPGLITDLVLSLDDHWLYFSNWLHGDVRQYDVSDPAHPRLAGRLWLGGVLGTQPSLRGRPLCGGPQMLQLSHDGRRLYVTNSLFSSWDNQFYPSIARQGSYMVQIDCDPAGGMQVNEAFFVDFGKEPHGPARAHEMRFPDGDCTSDIWV